MTDLMQRLRQARPTDADFDRIWPAEDRAAALDRILTNTTAPRPHRRRAWLVAAAVIGALVVVANLLNVGGTAQAELRELAMAAARADGPVIEQGTYLHVKTEAIQRNSSLFGDGQTYATNRESWVRWDGRIWAIDSSPSARWREYHEFPRPQQPYVNYPTPEFAASLPDDADSLRTYLDKHVTGSNSHDQAIFVAITDLARSHYLPPKTLSAALKVLADVDGVDTRDVTVLGRDAVEVTYSRFWGLLGQQTVVLDRATARVIAEHDSDPGGSYDLTTTLVEVVDQIPDDIRQTFQQLDNGQRVYNPHPAKRGK